MTSNIIKRMKKQELLRNTLSKMNATRTDFSPIEFKSVSDLSLHMASFSLAESPDSDGEFPSPEPDQWLELGPMRIFARPSFADLPPPNSP